LRKEEIKNDSPFYNHAAVYNTYVAKMHHGSTISTVKYCVIVIFKPNASEDDFTASTSNTNAEEHYRKIFFDTK
jgi:hypothetical protein